jgi:nitrate/TMAO reductase-like tetraheme cytochrome c subunit
MAMRANFARQQMDEARRAAEAKERNVKLLQDCHKRISHSTPQWGDRDLLQRISEEVMEAGK